MNVNVEYDWIPFIQELAHILVGFESKQEELIQMLDSLREDEGLPVTPTRDRRIIRSNTGRMREEDFKLAEIDPFSFMGCFNRGTSQENRLKTASSLQKRFDLKNAPPTNLRGVPVLNNQKSFLFGFTHTRKKDDIPILWDLFKVSLETDGLDNERLSDTFDKALSIAYTGPAYISMGLFWIRPDLFLPMDRYTRKFLQSEGLKPIPSKIFDSFSEYRALLKNIDALLPNTTYPAISDRVFKEWEPTGSEPLTPESSVYTVRTMIDEGAFLSEEDITQMLARIESKKAIILQGPPGVGKTFLAKKIASVLLGFDDPKSEYLERVQLHASYSYDDFVRGFRPSEGNSSGFELEDGAFLKQCTAAIKNPEKKYVLLIDEINRGNLGQIFGEMFSLIEADKRSPNDAISPLYRRYEGEIIYVPENLYLIGTMNLADRSLALVDYALRRRFAFITLSPLFSDSIFTQWLKDHNMPPGLISKICNTMIALNEEIREAPSLGNQYEIGHSFFCPSQEDYSMLDNEWFYSILKTEIIPLIEEYWFDEPDTLSDLKTRLLN